MRHLLVRGNPRQFHSAAAALDPSFTPRLPHFASSIILPFQRIVGIHPDTQLAHGSSYCNGGSHQRSTCRQSHCAAANLGSSFSPRLPVFATPITNLPFQRIGGPAPQLVLGSSYCKQGSDHDQRISPAVWQMSAGNSRPSSRALSTSDRVSGTPPFLHLAAAVDTRWASLDRSERKCISNDRYRSSDVTMATIGPSFCPSLPISISSSIMLPFQRTVGIHPATQLALRRSYYRGAFDHDQRTSPTGTGQKIAGNSMLSSRAVSTSDKEKIDTNAIKEDGKKPIKVQRGATHKASKRGPKEDQASPASNSGPPALLCLAAEVDTICSILGELEQAWTPQTESALDMSGIQIRPSHVIRVLERQQLNPALALRFFDWAAQQPGCEHTSSTFNALLGILGRAKMFADAEKVLRQMERKGVIKTRLVLATLATTYGMAGMEKEALESLNQMKNLGVRPNVYSYNSLMNVLAKAGFHDKVQFVYSHMLGARCPPDIYTFGILISAFVRAGELERAFKTFADMKLQAFQPNVVVYTSLINGLCKAGQLEKAGALFVEMNKKGCTPNTFTYNALLDGLGKSGRIEQAGKLFAEMIEVGCVDAVSYKLNTQFSMLGKAGIFKSGVKY